LTIVGVQRDLASVRSAVRTVAARRAISSSNRCHRIVSISTVNLRAGQQSGQRCTGRGLSPRARRGCCAIARSSAATTAGRANTRAPAGPRRDRLRRGRRPCRGSDCRCARSNGRGTDRHNTPSYLQSKSQAGSSNGSFRRVGMIGATRGKGIRRARARPRANTTRWSKRWPPGLPAQSPRRRARSRHRVRQPRRFNTFGHHCTSRATVIGTK